MKWKKNINNYNYQYIMNMMKKMKVNHYKKLKIYIDDQEIILLDKLMKYNVNYQEN